MMFTDIWPSSYSRGMVGDLFQPIIMYSDGSKYISISPKELAFYKSWIYLLFFFLVLRKSLRGDQFW